MAGLVAASPAAAETVTLAALGDSLTQGYGLPQEQGFVPQLEGWLEEHGEDVDIVNAGVSGDTTAGGLSRVDWTLTPDVDGLIVALGGNDLLRGIDPSVSRGNLDGLLQVAQAKDVPTMLIGLTAPGNYGPDYKQAFDAMYPELAKTYGSVYVESFLAPLEEMDDRQGAMRDYMQADGIHPNAEGVKLIVEALGPRVQQLIGRIVD
ncbi:acyl-CoA thioesterase-1 [Tranquillimonas alkanivorans]|uniref:Acyl-CoA thioesterase-1 n=1 Tax=Tranquillimonas alkanivorans TaxID=441119 RepID=A0A1I5KMQ5_9RHOB|nr:acyl-CoA thioesterase-1 [Tranquillimonas alkanivorans]